jgi:hypothetical protein
MQKSISVYKIYLSDSIELDRIITLLFLMIKYFSYTLILIKKM